MLVGLALVLRRDSQEQSGKHVVQLPQARSVVIFWVIIDGLHKRPGDSTVRSRPDLPMLRRAAALDFERGTRFDEVLLRESEDRRSD